MRCPRITALICVALGLCIGRGRILAAPAASQPSPADVLNYLNETIDWYRQVQSLEQTPGDSQELLLRSTVVQNARQTLQLAFRYAHGQSALTGVTADSSTTSRHSSITQKAAEAQERANQAQAQLNQLDHEIETAAAGSSDLLYAKRYEITAQLNLANTQRDVLQEYAQFMQVADNDSAAGFPQKIDQLEQSVPDLQTPADNAGASHSASAASTPGQSFSAESSGVLALVNELFRLSGRMSELKTLATRTTELQQTEERFREPLRDAALLTMQHSNAAASATQPSLNNPSDIEARGMQIDTFTDRFKLLSSASIPLAEQNIVLESSRQGLMDWHAALDRQYHAGLRALGMRMITVCGVIIVIFVISGLWRRATFRYIQDTRLQRQLMVIRRIVIGGVVLIIVIASVVNEFGSLATFAGLITAGVAVALQTVILSGVAYFFFIGRFGVRQGDRVTINNITGDVIEIGLFRIYLMELSGPTSDLHPTGRVVVFSNSVLFQPQAFYKQMPGSDYIWHRVALTLAPEVDINLAEKRLMAAVNSVFADYQQSIERQHADITRSLHMDLGTPTPEGRIRFIDTGLEFVVRYPVDLHDAAQIDDRMTRQLLQAINQEPKLKLTGSGIPKIQPA
ncbi:MAG TPA: mechanosensitive ion channel family protein [Tepidisphaeraceae bacterium]|nr:mechanosensitive ion channel family protein [Tepidisphaeraceae bacterium]